MNSFKSLNVSDPGLSDPRPVSLFQQQMKHRPETGKAPAAGVGKMVAVSQIDTERPNVRYGKDSVEKVENTANAKFSQKLARF